MEDYQYGLYVTTCAGADACCLSSGRQKSLLVYVQGHRLLTEKEDHTVLLFVVLGQNTLVDLIHLRQRQQLVAHPELHDVHVDGSRL